MTSASTRRRPVARLALTLLLACGATTTWANTSTLCNGRIFIDGVRVVGVGSDPKSYVLMRNPTNKPVRWLLTFGNMPKEVKLIKTQVADTLGAGHAVAVMLGTISKDEVARAIQRVYDNPVSGPYVMVSNCH